MEGDVAVEGHVLGLALVETGTGEEHGLGGDIRGSVRGSRGYGGGYLW